MCAPADVIRQTKLTDKNTELRTLEREKDEVEEIVREHLANSSASDLDTRNIQGLVPAVDYCHMEETDDSNQSEEEEHNVSNVQRSESESSKSSSEEKIDNESFQPSVKRRRDMTAKDLDIGDLFKTSMFENKKILEMAKMLHTMKDIIAFAFTEENVDLAIDPRLIGLSNTDKRKKTDLCRKELAEKKKSLDQLLSACYEEGDGSVSSGT